MLTRACISRAGFNRATAYSTATWVLASEFPDIDIAYYLRGTVEAFAHHRGWTHTFLAAPLNAAVVVGGIYLFDRWRGKRRSRDASPPISTKPENPHVETRHAASQDHRQPRWSLLFLFG